MKRILFFIVACMIMLPAHSQDIKVRRVKKIPVESKVYAPEFGHNSREILYKGENSKGLYQYNIRKRKTIRVVDDGTRVRSFSAKDDNTIVYSVHKGTGTDKEIEFRKIDPDSDVASAIESDIPVTDNVTVDGKKIILQRNNDKKELKPTGDNYYVWPSLSPDGQNILFTAVGKGTYVSDLDGNITADIGILNAPVWLNNQWVLGMIDKDDGYVTTHSDVYAVHLETGKKVEISADGEIIALYPKASPDGDRILFHNLKGEVFAVKIRVKN
ncbi:MAG: hypothetical protein WD578_11105 [Bacteroidales bacterium]